ncbi:MAG: phenylalanine--tRNA ligase subunit beta [Nevskia sp.]|nr:phenylalanine--tRNA ligase subunit beta [Nevskia sp.]
MKLSEQWLREWVNPAATVTEIAMKLNLAGLEAEAEALSSDLPQGVVVAKIIAAVQHPQAERLRVCEVNVGSGQTLSIVCGAANARPGILVPAALPGACLPGGKDIGRANLRGVDSAGMLCSASELGLAEKSEGLLELDSDAKPGTPIEQHLGLNDQLLNLDLTPNRGDCLSIAGLARELAAIYDLQQTAPVMRPAVVSGYEQIDVVVEDAQACPHYTGRVITKINPKARTPDWMRERLRRSGIRTIHPVVDITNYVMLELGQPLHAFDRTSLRGAIRIRRAKAGEKLTLLNEQVAELSPQDLLIADNSGPLVLAGVMGGTTSGVTTATTSIFLESACFDPATIAGAGRRHKLLSDSRYRNERGVDPALQRKALDRATTLIGDLCGGDAGPITEVGRAPAYAATVQLRLSQVTRLLGHEIPAREIPKLLARLRIETQAESADTWRARVPSYRYDLRIEADLVEEIGRLYGYDRIPARAYAAQLPLNPVRETQRPANAIKDLLAARGFQEIVTYSFVDPRLQAQLDPESRGIMLDNPIAETMAVMRTSLWSGLVSTWQYNRQRQTARAKLFELGACFAPDGAGSRETIRIGGLVAGAALPEQWGEKSRPADFYDAKADVAAMLPASGAVFRFVAAAHPALHPGQSARILRGDTAIGWLGALHPRLTQTLDLGSAPILFELDWNALRDVRLPAPDAVPDLPHSRRDLALLVAEEISADMLLAAVREAAGPLLRSASVFDVYRGAGLAPGHKSIAMGLIFQDSSRTLSLDEIDAAVGEIAASISTKLGASVRSR